MVAGSKPRTVLVVDDDEVIGSVLSRVLERDGYEVRRATSPGSALELARQGTPDVALVDLCYPDGDGVALAGQLRASRSDLPILLMTAYPVRLGERPELGRLFDCILNKPINLDELRQALNSALGAVAAGSSAASPRKSADLEEAAMKPVSQPAMKAATEPEPERGPFSFVRSLFMAAVVLLALAFVAVFVLHIPLPWPARANAEPAGPASTPPGLAALRSVELVPGMPHTLFVPEDVRKSLGIQKGAGDLVAIARPPSKAREMVLPGSTALDPSRLWRIRARFAPAKVVEVAQVTDAAATQAAGRTVFRELTTGDFVRKGDLLAVFYSVDVGNKKNDLIDALYQLKLDEEILRLAEKAAASGAVPEVFMLNAKRNVEGDRNAIARALSNLRTWEVSDEDIKAVYKEADEIAKRGGERDKAKDELWPRVELRAPDNGVVVECNIAQSETIVDQTVNLFQIAQVERLTVLANAPEDELPALNALQGQQRQWTVSTVGAAASKGVVGPITEIGYLIDPNQHTAVIKGFIDNKNGVIRAGQFVKATVQLPPPADVVEVPIDAVIDDGQQSIVFVQTDPGKQNWTMRRVELTQRFENTAFVRSKPFANEEQPGAEDQDLGMLLKEPLLPGERVLQTGAGELKAALLDKESNPKREND
jgi:cobalt-zinc-cadmium efflux system membrane fusion protein